MKQKYLIIILIIGILITSSVTIFMIMNYQDSNKDVVENNIYFSNVNTEFSYIENNIKENNIKENNIENDVTIISNDNAPYDNYDFNSLDIIAKDKNKVSITIKTGTLTVNGAVIIITDNNISHYHWNQPFKLQQKVDGIWKDIELQESENIFFPELQYDDITGIIEQSIDWSNIYGQVGVGEYRIVKEADNIEFYAKFEVQ